MHGSAKVTLLCQMDGEHMRSGCPEVVNTIVITNVSNATPWCPSDNSTSLGQRSRTN